MKIRVAFAIRPDYLTNFGGDSVQMLKTKEYLEKLYGVNIDIISDTKVTNKYSCYDILHIFNLQTADVVTEFISLYKHKVKKIVLSSIYWNLWHALYINFYFNLVGTTKGAKYYKWLEFLYRKVIKNFSLNEQYLDKKYIHKRKKIIENVDLILPNSYEELKIIARDFLIPYEDLQKKAMVIPNAYDPYVIKREDKSHQFFQNLRHFVLCVARIEPAKNQLGLLEALFDNPEIPIVFIGKAGSEKYLKKIKELSKKRGNVFILGYIEHESVYHFYKAASVHVLPSFRDSPGLSTLEALSVGCKVVVSSSEYCPLRYYRLDEIAYVCDPYDVVSIRKAVMDAMSAPKRSYDMSFYTYDNVAKLVYTGYVNLLNND